MQKEILIIGGGYVGFYTAIKLLNNKNIKKIDILDIDNKKIQKWKDKKNPIDDFYLESFLKKNKSFFEKISYIKKTNFKKYDFFLIALPTNPKLNKKINLSISKNNILYTDKIFSYCEEIISNKRNAKIIIRSTINYNDHKKITNLKLNYWPEFLSQGQNIDKNINGHKIIFTKSNNLKKEDIINLIPLEKFKNIVFLKIEEAIMIKIFHNSFDAFSITISNLLANIAQENNIKFSNLLPILNDLLKIKSRVKNPGLGYGGSCYPKDSRSLFNLIDSKKDFKLINQLDKYNSNQQNNYKKYLNLIKKEDKILILGISFKGQTNDLTETPTKSLINYLLRKKYNFKIWEPNIHKLNLKLVNKNIKISNVSIDIENDLKKADLIFIGSDWNIFDKLIKDKKIQDKKIIDLKSSLPISKKNIHYRIGDTIS
ncbi:/ ywqF / UDP-glucose 6-dehydrogenase ywqF /:446782 Forward [Candidatus Hepatoplasma crinochetorum]|uniref:/ ywqF / UDP-glucose 6-dehydrogenase ywqF /:446782 Forward n=1 Tax=Candidatus Hepatoplasma crinochetorum TaxID=295596 RepID=A0A0G7ZLA3_9MOLU|nr:/ ywqF / UDP-glucose 6-dehydrogenase ywqF /:446782 Forward [Candidatus Hepatoplasma crinochetorum]